MRGHGGWPSLDWPSMCQYFDIAVLGNGAAAPVLPPGVAYPFIDGSTPDFPKNSNAGSYVVAEAPTRQGTGLYTITYGIDFLVPDIEFAIAEVYGASGVWAQCSTWNAKLRQVQVRVFAAGGAAVDLVAGPPADLLIINIKARDTSTNKTSTGGT